MLVLSSFWFAMGYLMNSLGGLVLPRLVESMTQPTTLHLGSISFVVDKNTYVSFLEAFGALFAVVWQPAIGAISDHSRASIGRRRPFIAVGLIGDVIFLTVMAFVTSYWALLLIYVFFQLASNTVQGPYQGMLPDQVPATQRGEASGYYGALNLVGTIVGFLIIGGLLIPRGQLRLAVLSYAVLVGIIGAIVFFSVPDIVSRRPRAGPMHRTALLSVAIDVRRYPDFAWLMVSRLFFLMGPVGIGSYALFFLEDTFKLTPGRASVYAALLQAVIILVAAILAFSAGFLAERISRKRLISFSCLLGALGSGLLIIAPSIPPILVFGTLIGISLGIFFSVDWAFMTDLIPKAEAGRYMGVSNIATASAGLIARPILGPIIDGFNNGRTSTVGYRVMFGVVSAWYLVAFLTLRPVREIKVE
jgi:MFS family permease